MNHRRIRFQHFNHIIYIDKVDSQDSIDTLFKDNEPIPFCIVLYCMYDMYCTW